MTILTSDAQVAESNLTDPDTSFSEGVAAGWQAETIRTDAWNYAGRMHSELVANIMERVPQEQLDQIRGRRRQINTTSPAFLNSLFEAAAPLRDADPEGWAGLPSSIEELNAELLSRRRAELFEAEQIMGEAPVGAVAGTFARALTDEASLLTLPLGAGAGSSLKTIIATEAALGALGEAAVLPREFRVADELGLEQPDILPRLGLGAATGGALPLAFVGAAKGVPAAWQRGAQYRNTLLGASRELTPPGAAPVDHEARLNAAVDQLNGQTPPRASGQLEIGNFDYSRTGNASPSTNRIGYVFGRLLELGYEPHIAAGLTGNLMQESGVSINTRAVGDNGNAFGMAQWNGPRRRAYLSYAQSRGKDPADLDTQIAFLHHELTTSESSAAARILAAPDAQTAARVASDAFWRPGIPHLSNRMGYADMVYRQYAGGGVPKWQGELPQNVEFTPFTTSRGFTSAGQVSTSTGRRIGVEYQVVDASLLTRASGELQPRDRSRLSSDEQISEIAARLDPARLLPSPEADRGAPIVGPDNVIESGNGRVLALQRAAERHPDRFDAYRQQITDAGFDIPPGVETPVLVARRSTDLTPDARRAFVREANSAPVARMSATERARSDADAVTHDVIGLFDAAQPLRSSANRPFVRSVLDALPQAERNGLVDRDGALNAEGVARIKQALFARAYDAPDIVARYAETDAGELRGLMDALEAAAPEWSALRAAVAAGDIGQEFDITAYLLDAMRLISTAREVARRETRPVADVVEQLLADVDLLSGAVAPLTVALARKLMPAGRVASKGDVASFLRRYAVEAQKVGGTGGGLFGDGPTPADVLRAIDADTFGDLNDLGTPTIDTAPEPEWSTPAPELAEGAAGEVIKSGDDLLLEQLTARTRDDGVPDELRALAEDFEFTDANGAVITGREILDDLADEKDLSEVVAICVSGGGNG